MGKRGVLRAAPTGASPTCVHLRPRLPLFILLDARAYAEAAEIQLAAHNVPLGSKPRAIVKSGLAYAAQERLHAD